MTRCRVSNTWTVPLLSRMVVGKVRTKIQTPSLLEHRVLQAKIKDPRLSKKVSVISYIKYFYRNHGIEQNLDATGSHDEDVNGPERTRADFDQYPEACALS